MKKEHDYFLELLSNPTFSAKDFQLVGLSSENTSIQDKSKYKNSEFIQDNSLFQTDGNFDESKFDKAYEQALQQYNDLALLTQYSKPFFRDDIFAPEELKNKKDTPEFIISKVQNPLRQQESFVNFGIKEKPTQSVREIAQTKPTFDYKTGKWLESPNETWISNFTNPKVLAQWDFDADKDGNPTTNPEEIVFHKGDKKINPITGTYYYETLGNRDIYGKEVLSGFDTLTVDGSAANKIDFFDSDGLDKSVAGSLSRAVAQIAPVFIPYVGEVYIGSRIALSMSELLPTVGKIFLGNDNEFLSKIEAINKATSFSTSDYTQGSSEAKIEANPWTMETGLKLISDVFTQLAEQRWLFKYGTALFANVNPKIIGETEAAQAARQALIERNAAKTGLNFDIKSIQSLEDLQTNVISDKAINFSRAKVALDKQLKSAQNFAKNLSIAYMTGITTASSYGEAKQQGASDIEASLFALGYTAGEYALLSSDLGRWILNDLKIEKFKNRQVVRDLTKLTKERENLASPKDKQSLYKRIFNYGKQLATQDYDDSILKSASKMTVSSMLSEGIEETSEELLLDFSKSIFNVANTLRGDETKFDDAWKDIATRYGMSFIGGTLGGGIATALPGYRAARNAIKNTLESDQERNSAAYKQAVYLIADGKGEELKKTASKMSLGSKDLSTQFVENSDGTYSFKPAESYEDSQDYAIKQEFYRQIDEISDILNSEGAKVPKSSLLNDKLIRRELKFHTLLQSNVLGVYTNDFNNLLCDLTSTSKQINLLEAAKAGNDPNKTDTQNNQEKKSFSSSDEQKLQELKKEQKVLREKLEKYKNGSMANEFIGEALFELDTNISSAYAPTDFRRWVEEQSKKKFTELSDSERSDYQKRWNEASINRREIIHNAYQVFKQNQKALSDVLKKHEEEYYQDNDKNILRELESLFLNDTETTLTKSKNIVEDTEAFIPGVTRLTIWEGLLNSMKNSLDENTYNNFRQTFDNLRQSYEQSLNIKELPKSIEELNNLSPEVKQRIIEDLGQGEEFDPSTDQDLMNAIQNRKTEFKNQKLEDFKSGWTIFLSNNLVQEEFIKLLENTKYLTPTTKQYLKDFISKSDIVESNKVKINDALNKVSNSPIEELLSNMISTLQEEGIDTTGMIANLASSLNDLANSSNIGEFSYTSQMDQNIRKTLDLIELAHSHIEAAKTEIVGTIGNLYGYNATINELQEKYPIEGQKQEKLVQLKASTANTLLYELAKIGNDLRFYQAVFDSTTNAKLTDHLKTDLKLNTLYYGNLKKWSLEIPDDWEGKKEVQEAITKATTIQSAINNNSELVSNDERTEILKERLNIEQSIYNLFQQNKNKDIKDVLKSFNFLVSNQNLLNSGTEYQPDRDFVWYLASLAANNPTLILNEFKNSIEGRYAPIIAQEEAVRRVYSYLLNPQVFEQFAKAYNDIYKEQLASDRAKNGILRTDLDTDEYLLSTRHFLIEGIPGSGKSSAVYQALYNLLKANHPELLQKIWFVSNSKENAEQASKNMTNVEAMSKQDYFKRIGIGYNQEYDENGLIRIDPNNFIEDENGINHYKDVTLNEKIESPTLIFFDEVSSFSQQDLLLSEDFLKTKGIYSIAAGDFDQIGAQGKFKDSNGDDIYIRLSNSNFISSWKLGSSMRSNNTYKSKNISVLRESIKDFYKKLNDYKEGIVSPDTPIKLSYYESFDGSNKGLYGDKVVRSDEPQKWEQSIRNMLDSLGEGEQLNYIYDDPSTELYQTLKALNEGGQYKGKINFVTAGASQGQEGQYYVIELNQTFENAMGQAGTVIPETGKLDPENEITKSFGKTIYTAISRAKQGSLIVGNYDADLDISLFQSIPQGTLQTNNLSEQVIQNFGNERKTLIEKVIGEVKESTKINRDIPKVEEAPQSSDENPSGDDITEEETLINNQDRPNQIDNSKEGELNILMHSFMCQETGCETRNGNEPTDPNVQLVLGKFFEQRIDNLNGLAQIDKRSKGQITLNGVKIDSNGNILEGKDLLLLKLNQIRNFACYTKNNESLINLIKQTLGTTVPLKIEFAYKNQYRNYQDESETIKWFEEHPEYKKFYKGKKEYLAGIFNESNISEDIREPKDQVIEIIITLEDGTQLLEVPLCKMTSPLTLLNTSEFSGIKQIFDQVGQDVSKFKKEVKRLLQQNSNIPHLREYGMLLELWEHSAFNTISYLGDNFNLADFTKTGITTTSHERGADYFKTLNYYYDGKWMALEDYKQRMPWRKISKIYTSVEQDGRKVVEINGSEIQVGKPFVLVSDYYNVSDEELLKLYVKQCKDKSDPLIRLVYVTPPTATMEEYIFNLNNALTKNGSNFENVDKDLGTKITAFRLLQFALADGSNFRQAFNNWINNSPQANKEGSINRMEAISNLVKVLTEYEKTNGKSKLYELLNTPIKNIDNKLKNLLKYSDNNEDKWIMGITSNLTLRHVLQQELHKMLLSDLFYGDSLQSKMLRKQGNAITFPDNIQDKVNAFIKDAKLNNWTGVQYHLKLKHRSNLEEENTYIIENLRFAEIDTELGSEYSVSGKPIQINGKLDSTSFVLNVVPLMKEIIKGGLARDISKISTDNSSTNIFADLDKNSKEDYNTNQTKYLYGRTSQKKVSSLDKRFSDIVNKLKFERGQTNKNKEALTKTFNTLSNQQKEQVLNDPRQFIFNTIGLLSKEINGELNIVKNLDDAQDIIYLNDNIIFRRKSDLSKVYTLTNQKEVIPINQKQFEEITKNLPPSDTLTKLSSVFQNIKPQRDAVFNIQEIIPKVQETLNKHLDSIPQITLDQIEKNIQFLSNSRRISRLSNIYIKNIEGKWDFTINGNILASILAATNPKIYNDLVNDETKHDILNNLITDLQTNNKDFIDYIEQQIKEQNNEICSFIAPF